MFWNLSSKWNLKSFNKLLGQITEEQLTMFWDCTRTCKSKMIDYKDGIKILFFSFLEPIVLLERIAVEIKTVSASNQYQEISSKWDDADTLATKGNKALCYFDPHTCFLCQKVYSGRWYLKIHLKNVHCRSKKFFCDLCPKFYFTKRSISEHLRHLHASKRFACNVCDYKTAVEKTFRNHKMTHTAKVECPICKKPVTVLKEHMKFHDPKENCSICSKLIAKNYMTKHLKFHSREIQKCKCCTETFNTKEELKR